MTLKELVNQPIEENLKNLKKCFYWREQKLPFKVGFHIGRFPATLKIEPVSHKETVVYMRGENNVAFLTFDILNNISSLAVRKEIYINFQELIEMINLKDLQYYNYFRNKNISDAEFFKKIQNPLYSYLIAFASSQSLRDKKPIETIQSKIIKLLANQLASLPLTLNDKIKNDILKKIVKEATVFKFPDNHFGSGDILQERVIADVISRKYISLGRYIIPAMLGKVILTESNIEEMFAYIKENLGFEISISLASENIKEKYENKELLKIETPEIKEIFFKKDKK